MWKLFFSGSKANHLRNRLKSLISYLQKSLNILTKKPGKKKTQSTTNSDNPSALSRVGRIATWLDCESEFRSPCSARHTVYKQVEVRNTTIYHNFNCNNIEFRLLMITGKLQNLPEISWFALHALFGWFCVGLFEGTPPLKNGLSRQKTIGLSILKDVYRRIFVCWEKTMNILFGLNRYVKMLHMEWPNLEQLMKKCSLIVCGLDRPSKLMHYFEGEVPSNNSKPTKN